MAAILRTFWCKYISASDNGELTTDNGQRTRDLGPVARKEPNRNREAGSGNEKGTDSGSGSAKKWRRQRTTVENRKR